jgi:hypothetical protein
VKTYVYFAFILTATGCAYGSMAGVEKFEQEDAGNVHPDAGSVKDAKAPVKDAGVVQPEADVPDVTMIETCDPLPLATGIAMCDTCLGSYCCSADQTCGNDPDCMSFIECVDDCVSDGGDETSCETDCEGRYPTGASELDALDNCLASSCGTECQ